MVVLPMSNTSVKIAIALFMVPAATIIGYYFVTAAKVMDAALALPTKMPPDRRRNFKVIQGGRA
jgi:hypothetical protein